MTIVLSFAVRVVLVLIIVAAVAVVVVVKTLGWAGAIVNVLVGVFFIDVRTDVVIDMLSAMLINVFTDVMFGVIVEMLTGGATMAVSAEVIVLEFAVPLSFGIDALSDVVVNVLIDTSDDVVIGVVPGIAVDVLAATTLLEFVMPARGEYLSCRAAFDCWLMAFLYCDRVLQALPSGDSVRSVSSARLSSLLDCGANTRVILEEARRSATVETSRFGMSPLNDFASKNIFSLLVTLDTSHFERSPLNDAALKNM